MFLTSAIGSRGYISASRGYISASQGYISASRGYISASRGYISASQGYITEDNNVKLASLFHKLPKKKIRKITAQRFTIPMV